TRCNLFDVCFFFSSRRRHTRSTRDWSSDVCSSDLLAGLSPRLARENRRQKEFLHSSLYSHENISAEREKIVKRVEELFGYFMEHPRSLPARYFAKTKEEPVHRVVCDYTAGMTDNYL